MGFTTLFIVTVDIKIIICRPSEIGLERDVFMCVTSKRGNRLYVLDDLNNHASGSLALAFYSEPEYDGAATEKLSVTSNTRSCRIP